MTSHGDQYAVEKLRNFAMESSLKRVPRTCWTETSSQPARRWIMSGNVPHFCIIFAFVLKKGMGGEAFRVHHFVDTGDRDEEEGCRVIRTGPRRIFHRVTQLSYDGSHDFMLNSWRIPAAHVDRALRFSTLYAATYQTSVHLREIGCDV